MSVLAPIPREAWPEDWKDLHNPVDAFPDWNPFDPPYQELNLGARRASAPKPDTCSPAPKRDTRCTQTSSSLRRAKVVESDGAAWELLRNEAVAGRVASFLRVRAKASENGVYVANVNGRFLPFGVVWASRAYRESGFLKLSRPALGVWTAGLLITAGETEPAPAGLRPLPPGSTPHLISVYDAVGGVLGASWLNLPMHTPVVLARKFLVAWASAGKKTSPFGERIVGEKLTELEKLEIIRKVDMHELNHGKYVKRMNLWLPVE